MKKTILQLLLILPIFIFVFLFKTVMTVSAADCGSPPAPYPQCGAAAGSCVGAPYPSNHTVIVTTTFDADCNKVYGCEDKGALPGQCGNPSTGKCTGSISYPGGNTCNSNYGNHSLNVNWDVQNVYGSCNIYIRGGSRDEQISTSCSGLKTITTFNGAPLTNDGIYELFVSNGDNSGNCYNISKGKATIPCSSACEVSWSLSNSSPPANTEFTATVRGLRDVDWGNVKWRVDTGSWSGTFTSVTPGNPPVFVFKPNSGAAGAHNLEFSAANGVRLCTPKQPFTTGGGSPPPSGSCPVDSKLTITPPSPRVGDAMTFQYQAGEDVYIGGDTWSGGVKPNPCTLDSNLANRRYTCTADSAVTNATWKHYWNNGQPGGPSCGSATYTITGGGTPTPTPTPGPTTTTVSYRVAESVTELSSALWLPYTAITMTIPFEFKDKTPGNKFVWVEFKDDKGKTEKHNAQITLLGPDPTIKSCLLSFEGVNTILNLKGENFGTSKGEVKSGETTLQIRDWKNDLVRAMWQNAPEGQILPVTLTNPNGQSAEGQCSSISLLSLGAKVFCRMPSNHQTDNVDLVLVGAYEGGTRVKQKVSIDKEGIIQGLNQKLESGRNYKLSIKAPKALRRAGEFTAEEGVTIVPNFILPVGDIFPLDGGDSSINSFDKAELNRQFVIAQDACGRSGDFNKDCRVNSIDWACMRYDFGKPEDPEPVPGSSPTPTPSPRPVVNLQQDDGG